jgi:hypothetical protein
MPIHRLKLAKAPGSFRGEVALLVAWQPSRKLSYGLGLCLKVGRQKQSNQLQEEATPEAQTLHQRGACFFFYFFVIFSLSSPSYTTGHFAKVVNKEEMAEPKIPLATLEQIHEIAERSLRRFDQQDTGLFSAMTYGECEYLAAAFRFCADTAVDLKETSLLPLLIRAVHLLEAYSDNKDHCEHLAYCIQMLLAFGGALSEPVERFSRHKKVYARRAIAKGLIPRGVPEIAILENLAKDPNLEVRKVAKENLQKVMARAWWDGLFQRDPTIGLSTEEEARLRPVFENLCTLLAARACNGQEIAHCARSLPDLQLFDCSSLLLASVETIEEKGLWPLLTVLLERPNNAPMLRRLFERWRDKPNDYSFRNSKLKASLDKASPEALKLLCVELIASIREALREAPIGLTDKRASNAAKVLAFYWPAGPAPVELFELLVALPRNLYEGRELSQSLMELFTRPDIDPTPVLTRAIALHLSAKDEYTSISAELVPLLRRTPPAMIRTAAQQALSSSEMHTVAWGLEQLIERAHDPTQDPPPVMMLSSLLENPLYKTAILQSEFLRERALPALRQELRTRSLRFPAAAKVMQSIINLYGKQAHPAAAKRIQGKLQALGAFAGPEELQGPPTEEEWASFRIARAQHSPADFFEWQDACYLLPRGAWHLEDRAFFEESFARCRRGDQMLAYPLMTALVSKPFIEDLPLVEELFSLANEDSQGALKLLRKNFLAHLGVKEGEEQPSSKPTEWMDEPEGDDEEL